MIWCFYWVILFVGTLYSFWKSHNGCAWHNLHEPSHLTRFELFFQIYVLFFMPHCFMPFAVLKSKLYLPFLWTTKAPCFLFFGTWPLWGKVAKALLRAPKPKQDLSKETLKMTAEEQNVKETSGNGDSAPAAAPVAQEEDKKTQWRESDFVNSITYTRLYFWATKQFCVVTLNP